jgi:hypothetical protein
MAEPRRLYSRTQIQATERRAWSEKGEHRYYFDGILFWKTVDGHESAARLEDVPEDGWWHREGCNCTLCSGAGAGGG